MLQKYTAGNKENAIVVGKVGKGMGFSCHRELSLQNGSVQEENMIITDPKDELFRHNLGND